ncbi:hypothetical protein DEU56DRAFT_944418 [Suillus clintonianus]|uniref:uncharacterized protein n=1 Tax=Suillus clintonianus TaxID=1904413 RepID=UPI001B876CF0|nr:uncharacterized protein DEU56DRAFT_944418 [Suillus clintonianus]KAG2139339.1 hypothetical protein DEU56DRAFT_944418 [Suillus clintonianus]
MASRAPIDDVLDNLQLVGISVSHFLLELLANKKYINHIAVKDILHNRHQIVDALSTSAEESPRTELKWAMDLVKDICVHKMVVLSAKESGYHFDVVHTAPEQLEDFSIEELAKDMEKLAPVTWDFLNTMLSARMQRKTGAVKERNEHQLVAGMDSDEEAYWEELGEGDLEGIISGLTNDAESSLENQRKAKALLRKVTVLSIMMRSTNQRSNTLQSLVGMFLQSTHTPQKVIEMLKRMGVSVSVNAIFTATHSLSAQTHRTLRSLGQSLLATYAYDNFDVDLKTHEHKIENSTESLKHLTSGLMFPLQHCTSQEDLRSLPKRGWKDLLSLQPDTPNLSGLTCRDHFNSWKFLTDLITYGPPYFTQFKDWLREPELVEGIPVVKTPTMAASAMDVSNSTVAGNIQSVINLLEQGGIAEPNSFDDPEIPDISEYVVMFHGNLGTGKRLQVVQQHRAIENSPWDRFQHVVFVPGMFHLKMAAADSICLMRDMGVLRPKETGHYGSKPGFCRMHQLIGYDGICHRLDCWRIEARKRMNYVDLEVFAASEPSYEDLQAMADSLARDYVADHKIRRMRNKSAAERDQQHENGLLLNKYVLLFEELSYAMNIGDIGRLETCLVTWILMFKATSKHKYANTMLEFLCNVHFVYPEGLKHAVRYHILIKPTGKKGKLRGVDWCIELNNLFTKGQELMSAGDGVDVVDGVEEGAMDVDMDDGRDEHALIEDVTVEL